MDMHSFVILAKELLHLLDGARVEKIHGPHPGVYLFSLYVHGKKRRLLFRHERQSPLLFSLSRKLENPPSPPAQVMRLRKYCAGKKLGKGLADPATRSLAFALPELRDAPKNAPEHHYLLLNMTQGAEIVSTLPVGFGQPLFWPDSTVVDALCAAHPHAASMPDTADQEPRNKFFTGEERGAPIWQEYAVLTPLLRETLACLDSLEARALLVDLEAGQGDLFLYADKAGKPVFYAAWPLPAAVLARRALRPCSVEEAALHVEAYDFQRREEGFEAHERAFQQAFPVLYQMGLVDEARFFADFGNALRADAQIPEKRHAKRQARLVAKLDQEEARLKALLALREQAKALQAVLWQYPPDAKQESVTLAQSAEPLALNPRLTIRENMAFMFRQSARGARGLAILEERRAAMNPAVQGDEQESLAFDVKGARKQRKKDHGREFEAGTGKCALPHGGKGNAFPSVSRESGDVALFSSSDGFTLLRGKNAQGNLRLLKTGKGHDLWVHVEDGPGAHVLIRRTHAAEEPPEATLREAARLAAEKSWQRDEPKARVMFAFLRHVHPIKGAPPGTVRIDAVLRRMDVENYSL